MRTGYENLADQISKAFESYYRGRELALGRKEREEDRKMQLALLKAQLMFNANEAKKQRDFELNERIQSQLFELEKLEKQKDYDIAIENARSYNRQAEIKLEQGLIGEREKAYREWEKPLREKEIAARAPKISGKPEMDIPEIVAAMRNNATNIENAINSVTNVKEFNNIYSAQFGIPALTEDQFNALKTNAGLKRNFSKYYASQYITSIYGSIEHPLVREWSTVPISWPTPEPEPERKGLFEGLFRRREREITPAPTPEQRKAITPEPLVTPTITREITKQPTPTIQTQIETARKYGAPTLGFPQIQRKPAEPGLKPLVEYAQRALGTVDYNAVSNAVQRVLSEKQYTTQEAMADPDFIRAVENVLREPKFGGKVIETFQGAGRKIRGFLGIGKPERGF